MPAVGRLWPSDNYDDDDDDDDDDGDDDDDDDDDEQGGGGGAAQLHGVRGPGRGGARGGGGAGARLLRPLQRRRVPQLHRGQGPRLVQHQVRRC